MKTKKNLWNLKPLLNKKNLNDNFKEWLKQKNYLIKIYPSFCKTFENFKEWHIKELEFAKISNRIANYISCNLTENVISPLWNKWTQKFNFEFANFQKQIANIENIILKNKKNILCWIEDDFFKDYKRSYLLLFKSEKHILLENEEKIITDLLLVTSGFYETFSIFSSSNIKYDKLKNKFNKNFSVATESDIFKYLKSKDEVLRKNAWNNYNNTYFKYKETLSSLLYYSFLNFNTIAKLRNFNDYVDMCCYEDEIDESLILFIYKKVLKFSNLAKRFYEIRNKILKINNNLKKVNPWDKNLSIISFEKDFPLKQAKEIVLDSYKIFGNDYVSLVNRIFKENWISYFPKENKQQGAYTVGDTLGLNIFPISLDYDQTISSVYTLTHEIGHAFHAYWSSKYQKVNSENEIFYSEIPSIANEVILSYSLMNKYKNKKIYLLVLDEMICNFFDTVIRQTVFSNFEYIFSKKIAEQKFISYDEIEKIYGKLLEKYYLTKTDKKINKSLVSILRIDHFYAGNFYVYKYVIGQIIGFICAQKLINNENNFLNKYFNFLASGSSLSPLDTIKLLGFNLKDNEIWLQCFKNISSLVDLYEKEYKKLIVKK